jgi:hypothetical protein
MKLPSQDRPVKKAKLLLPDLSHKEMNSPRF